MAPTRKLAELFFDLRARTEGLQQDLDKSERALGKLTSFVLKNPVAALAALGTAAATTALRATQMAATIDASMRKVASSVPQGAAGLDTLRQSLERISLETGKTQEELGQAAELIARTGAGSAEEVAQRLKAVSDASQATGTDLQAVIAGLDQTLDLFGLSSQEASAALAELFTVVRGKTSLEDLFAQLQAAAPSIQQLGLDLPTAARALVQLGESGLSVKQAATELKNLAQDGAAGRAEIERLAASIPKASNPMRELAEAAERVNDSATNAGPRLRAEFNATLITLGNEILPAVNAGMAQLLRTFQQFRGGTTTDLRNAFAAVLVDGPEVLRALDAGAASSVLNQQTTGRFQALQRAILQLAEAAREGRVDLQAFGIEGLGQLAVQIDRFSRRPIFSKQQQAELREFLKQVTGAQRSLAEVAQRGGTLSGRAAPPTTSGAPAPTVDLDKELRRTEEISAQLDAILDAQRARRIEFARALIETGRATVDTLRQLIDDYEAEFVDRGFTTQQARLLADLKLGIKGATFDISAALKGLAELNKLESDRKKRDEERGKREAQATEEALQRAQRIGRSIEDIGKLVLSAADAFGLLGEEASRALASVIDVGAGLARIASGDKLGGTLQLASGALQLAGKAFGADPQAEERRRQHAENLAALKAIAQNTGDLLGVSASGGTLANIRGALAANLGQTADLTGARSQAANLLRPGQLSAATGLSVKELEAVAKSLNVTLDGTRQSYEAFLRALTIADLEAFAKGFTGQLRRLEIEARLDPSAFEGIDGLIKRLQVLAGPDGAPAIAKALDGLDISTSAGRAAAIEKLTATLRNLSSLDVADLGGLSLDQFIEEILSAIEKLRALEPAARTAAERFGDALDLVALEFELGGLDAAGRLKKVQAAFAASFGEAFADLDFSSLESLQASIAGIIASLTADGKLTDEEQALAAALRQLLEAFAAAQPAAQTFTDALQVLADRFEIFGSDAVARFKLLGDELADQFPTIGALLAGLDIANDADLEELRRRARELFDGLALDGVTAEEQAIIDAIKQILKAAGDAAGDIAAEEARLRDEAAERRRKILRGADTRIRLDDVTDPLQQFRIRIEAFAKAFPELAGVFSMFDTATQEGRDALEAWIRSIAESPEDLERLADAMGISVDELLQALLELEDGADAAKVAVQTLAQQLQQAFAEVDFDLALNNITDPVERLTRAAKGIAGIVPQIDAALKGIDLSTADGRAKAEAALVALGKSTADGAVRDAVLRLLEQIRGIGTGGTDSGGAGGGFGLTPEGRAAVASAATVTEVTANRWLDIMTTDLALSRQRNQTLDAILATVASAPTFVPPLLTTATGAAGGATTVSIEIPVNFLGPVTTADAPALAALLQAEIYRLVTTQLATELQASQILAGRNRI